MKEIWQIFIDGYLGYASYLKGEIMNPGWHNYFYLLTLVSILFFILEIIIPWRKKQSVFRKDFWLDFFYMYFNFFIFSLIIYNAGSDVIVHFVQNVVGAISGMDLSNFDPLYQLPLWGVLLLGFVLRDFIQWWTHRLLHKIEWLWKFHQVHHSVKEMGFAAHLRYHWMETIVYRTIEYLPLAFLGIGLYDFFIIHIFSLLVGHYNHSNLSISPKFTGTLLGAALGFLVGMSLFELALVSYPTPVTGIMGIFIGSVLGRLLLSPVMKILFNSPEMHIWHHAKNLPNERQNGVNFGLSLAIWDYLFGTAYIPRNGRDIELGFPDDENFPDSFIGQISIGAMKK